MTKLANCSSLYLPYGRTKAAGEDRKELWKQGLYRQLYFLWFKGSNTIKELYCQQISPSNTYIKI